ncbi:MAG: C-terminal binding protein [Alphaproteobacteria bacterium]|nr:C-terminal binding protein [Alphaproteobacteria bacterium]
MKAVITDHHYHDIKSAERVIADAGIDLVIGQCHTEDDAIRLGRDADAVINQHCPITDRVLASWPLCRGVVHFGKGVDNIDVDAATRRGIWVTNVRDANWDEVSNHVLSLILAWSRGLIAFDRSVRDGKWSYRLAIPRHRLAGQTLGIIGFGDIARLLASKAHALGMKVLAYARHPPEGIAHVTFVTLEDLMYRADFVSVHVPLTRETAGMIGAREIALMKPGAFLINTARGGVVDQMALVEALRAGRIAGAGLDVTDPEPLAMDDPIRELDNVILTPHVAWYSEESREHVTVEAAREVVRILRRQQPRSPVNPGVVPRG